MSKALYREYRPRKLSEVIGQDQVTKPLASAIKAGKISHAYLFIGPRGTGKTTVARILAHEINKFPYELEDNYVDIIEIDGASNRGIEDVRELREKAAIAPTEGKYKVYIIDEVHMFTKEAFNALLKTLEEPPAHVVFIMATTDAYKVPVTITSRSQTYTFKLADTNTIENHLKTVAKNAKIKIADDAIAVIAKRGGGSFRDSLSLLDQISTISENITKDDVIKSLGLPSDEIIKNLLTAYQSANVVKITTFIKELLSSGIKPEILVEELVDAIVANPEPAFLPLLSKLSDIKPPFIEAKLLVALIPVGVLSDMSSRETLPRKTLSATPTEVKFNQSAFLEKIKDLSEAVYQQLKKSTLELKGNELNVYPKSSVAHSILTSKNNHELLLGSTKTVKIIIHKSTEFPTSQKSDNLISQISDIMGGEVKEDGGENPF
ncbi:DNA polymerase III subunit gamma/tau [Candidatus Saccharibacteria bacterium]|nr:DNA polymerase III subunit gamma/tau [Candidatus Saccharibacteria bacterium]